MCMRVATNRASRPNVRGKPSHTVEHGTRDRQHRRILLGVAVNRLLALEFFVAGTVVLPRCNEHKVAQAVGAGLSLVGVREPLPPLTQGGGTAGQNVLDAPLAGIDSRIDARNLVAETEQKQFAKA